MWLVLTVGKHKLEFYLGFVLSKTQFATYFSILYLKLSSTVMKGEIPGGTGEYPVWLLGKG